MIHGKGNDSHWIKQANKQLGVNRSIEFLHCVFICSSPFQGTEEKFRDKVNMKNCFEEKVYEAPEIEVITVYVERGFEDSNVENPSEEDPTDW